MRQSTVVVGRSWRRGQLKPRLTRGNVLTVRMMEEKMMDGDTMKEGTW